MDDGLRLSIRPHYTNVNQHQNRGSTKLCYIELSYSSKQESKHWESIRDVIIPFFIHLSRQYNVIRFGELSSLSSDNSSHLQGLGSIPVNLKDEQIQFGLVKKSIGHMGIQRKRVSVTIQDLEHELVSKIDDMLSKHSLVETIGFYVTEVPFGVTSSKPSIGKKIKRYLGF
jgi:hypothetical protein